MNAATAGAQGGSFLFGPLGEEAGQISNQALGPDGLAADGQTGTVYVSDTGNERVDEFKPNGEFSLAWGWGVATGADELQTCTTTCQRGLEGQRGTGALCLPSGIGVDDGGGSSQGDVYVVSFCEHRVEKFDSSGKFLLMFGGHVNAESSPVDPNVCMAGEACQAGSEGTGDGEFEWAFSYSYIAVGPNGDVYVGDRGRVQIFEPSGRWKQSISLAALSSEEQVTALTVDSLGDVYVKVKNVPGVHKLEPPLFVESPVKIDEASLTVGSLAVDGSNDLFVSENKQLFEEPCVCELKEYDPAGQQVESFGAKTLVYMTAAMAFAESAHELLVYGTDRESANAYGHFGVWGFALPPPGPLILPDSETARPEAAGAASLQALVNPEGNPTEVSFEYVSEAQFQESGYAGAATTPPVALEATFQDEHAQVQLPSKSLIPGATYHFRAVARSSQGTNRGADELFQETPPALVEGPWATGVTSTSVTFNALIDPLGFSTGYRLEYGTGTEYGHTLSGNVGEGSAPVRISLHVQGLAPSTVYHYRLVTENEVGVVAGADHTFTTQSLRGPTILPDGRSWEMVSPVDKGGALIADIETVQAARDGSGIVYSASEPLGENVSGHIGFPVEPTQSAMLLSSRAGGEWRTRDISASQSMPPEGISASELFNAVEAFYLFSPDLSLGAFEPIGLIASQSTAATEPTPYIRNNTDGSFQPLLTSQNVSSGAKWSPVLGNRESEARFEAATPDLKHVVLSDYAALTAGAAPGGFAEHNLYEWNDGELRLVNVLPDGTSAPGAGFGEGQPEGIENGGTPWALSSDGRWIVFHYGKVGGGERRSWYVRDMTSEKTAPFGRPGGLTEFESMSRDGARVFYVEPEGVPSIQESSEGVGVRGELFVLDSHSGTTTDLTATHLAREHDADVMDKLLGISEDGSYVYFAAKGKLAEGATPGENNLYVAHFASGAWTLSFIAALSGEDEKDYSYGLDSGRRLRSITSRVSPNGRFLAFMSDRSLTGYDNRDATSGEPDEEVYLYDAADGSLVCTSCDSTGARPIGVHEVEANSESLLIDAAGAWSGREEAQNLGRGHWLAAILPGGWRVRQNVAFYQPRDLSDSGRLLFNSSDALAPQDTNGLADVYEYERSGVGGCAASSASFDARAGGCVSLITSGQSGAESTFFDASESGDDVFFVTASKLAAEDKDTAFDVYDAHVCAAAAPCLTKPVSPPACASGDSCKPPPSSQPQLFGPPPSATFSGTGNVRRATPHTAKPRSSTRAKRLRRALRRCRRHHSRRLRISCERRARKRYGSLLGRSHRPRAHRRRGSR